MSIVTPIWKRAAAAVDAAIPTSPSTETDALDFETSRLRKLTIDALEREIRGCQTKLIALESEAHRVINQRHDCQQEMVRRLQNLGIRADVPELPVNGQG